jgi:hypothetical protein
MMMNGVLAAGLLASMAAAQTIDIAGFNYTVCQMPNTTPTQTTIGQRTGVCVNLNGHVRALMTPVVDQYSAFQLVGSEFASESFLRVPLRSLVHFSLSLCLLTAGNYAFPANSGYLVQGGNWTASISPSLFNCSGDNWDPQTFYEVIDVTYGTVSSPAPRIYKQFTYDGCTGTLVSAYTWPILTAIIQVEKGVPQYIAWDDGCFFCASNDPSVCQYYAFDVGSMAAALTSDYMSCLTPMTTCYPGVPGPSPSPVGTSTPSPTPSVSPSPNNSSSNFTLPQSECDLKLFIVWSGSDANNQYFTSANKRFSRFRQFGTATAFQSAINIGLQGLTIAQNTLGLVDGVPGRLLPGSQVRRRRRLHGVSGSGAEGHDVGVSSGESQSDIEEVLEQVHASAASSVEEQVTIPQGHNFAAHSPEGPIVHPWLEKSKLGNKFDSRLASHHVHAAKKMAEDEARKPKPENKAE